MHIRTGFRLLLLTASVVLECHAFQARSGVHVRILAIDSFGGPMHNCTIGRFYEVNSRQQSAKPEELAGRFKGLEADEVPVGQYYALVLCDNQMSAASIVNIDRSNTFVVVSSPGAATISEYPPGRVPRVVIKIPIRESSSGLLWVRLVGFFLNRIDSFPVASDGTVIVSDPMPGKYWLSLFEDGILKCHSELTLHSRSGSFVLEPGICSLSEVASQP